MQLATQGFDQPCSWAERWLDMEQQARLVLTRDLHPLWLTDAAVRLLEAGAPLVRKGLQVVGADRASHTALMRCVEAAAATGSAHALLAPESGTRQFVVKARALADAPEGPIGLTVRGEEQPDLPDMSDVFGLTGSERHVVSVLLKGMNPGEIADLSGTSVLTVRTHIKRAYSKLGIHTKEQLFAKLYMFLA